MEILDCKESVVDGFYCGKFISTTWYPTGGGWAGLMFKYKNNTAYPMKHFEKVYNITGSGSITLECDTDETEE